MMSAMGACIGATFMCPARGGEKCCHHLLDTGKRRERIGDVCLSKKEGKHKRGPNPFDIPVAQRRY